MLIRIFSLVAVLFLAALFLTSQANAQTIILDDISANVADGDEFFTDIWANPKNFDSPCDVGEDFNVFLPDSSFDGVWVGVNPFVTGPFMGIIPIPIPGTPLVYREDCTQLGLQHPLNANKYTDISYRTHLNHTDFTTILWSNNRNFALDGVNAILDTFNLPPRNLSVNTPINTWLLKHFSMPSLARPSYPWSGNITGLSLQPSIFTPTFSATHFDWLRITDPDTSPTVTFKWSNPGGGTNDFNSVALFVDDNNVGFDGMSLVHGKNVNDSYNLKTAILPPGTYYFYTQLESSAGDNYSVISRSNYVGPIIINGKPILNFTAPTRMSGREWSRDERLDAWDMSQASDVLNFNLLPGYKQNLQRGFHNPVISDGVFIAESDADPFGAAVTVDTNMLLAVPPNMPIDTSVYRYFCHRSQLDTTNIDRSINLQALNDAGSVTRLIFADIPTGFFSSTGGHQSIEKSTTFPDGLSTYCFDLWDDSIFEGARTWRSAGQISTMRFDPLESREARKFAVDFIGLYAENFANDQQYKISWNSSDNENDSLDIAFYYDTDRGGFNGTLIGTTEQSTPGAGEYIWNTKGVANGSYYIYAVVRDGVNVNRFYTEVTVNIGASSRKIAEEVVCDPLEKDCIFDELEPTACVGTNGFLNQINIATVINKLATPISVKVDYIDSFGRVINSVFNAIPGNQRNDYIVNEMGLQPDTLGSVCVTADASEGSWSGGLAIYKPDERLGRRNFGDAFDFALYYPFLNPKTGRTSAPLNTFHLGTHPGNTVANWVSISDAVRDGVGLGGVLRFYNSAGVLISQQEVGIPDGGRADFSGHAGLTGDLNFDAVGLAEFSPDPGPGGNSAQYHLNLTRYFYDCGGNGSSCTNFHTAFNIPFRPSTSAEVFGAAATIDGEISIVELLNSGEESVSTNIDVYSSTGALIASLPRGVPSRGNFNTILNRFGEVGYFSDNQSGSVSVKANNGSIQAISLFYKLDASGTLEYAYAAPFTESASEVLVTPFNSFISQKNSTQITNTSNSTQRYNLVFTDFEGRQLLNFSTPLAPKATTRLNSIDIDENRYGTIRLQSNSNHFVMRNYTSRDSSYVLPFSAE